MVSRAMDTQVQRMLEREWVEASTQELTVLSELAADLNAFRAVVSRLAPTVRGRSAVPTYVYLLTPASYPGSGSAGFFAQSLRANHLAVKTGVRRLPERQILFHEYTHLLFANSPAFGYPLWLNEGYADFLSTLEMREDAVRMGIAPKLRIQGLAGGGMTLRPLMRARVYPGLATNAFYSTSWLLTHYISMSHRSGLTDRRPQLNEYLALLQQGSDRDAAFAAAFKTTYKDMEKELLRYARELPVVDVSVGDLGPAPEVKLRALPKRELKLRVAEFLLDVSRESPSLAEFAREGIRERAAVLFGEVVSDGGEDAAAYANWGAAETTDLALARSRFAKALELAPDDPEVLALLGDQLRLFAERDAAARAALLEEARGLYRKALARDPDRARALAGLGAVCLASGSGIEEGVAPLERLRGLRRSPHISLTLARIYARVARPTDARRLALEVLGFAQHDGFWADQATQIIAELPPEEGSEAESAAQ
jgi:tetratricopeptide (TPR) repeat protein